MRVRRLVPHEDQSRGHDGQDTAEPTAQPERVDADEAQQNDDEQQQRVHRRGALARLHRVRVAEQRRAGQHPSGTPVAEDHRCQPDVAAAARLALAVDTGEVDQERPGESGQHSGGEHRGVLHPVDADAQGLGRGGILAARPQPQSEGSPPQDEPGQRNQQQGEDGEDGQTGGDASQQAADVGDEEPVMLLELAKRGVCPTPSQRLEGRNLRRLGRAAS